MIVSVLRIWLTRLTAFFILLYVKIHFFELLLNYFLLSVVSAKNEKPYYHLLSMADKHSKKADKADSLFTNLNLKRLL